MNTTALTSRVLSVASDRISSLAVDFALSILDLVVYNNIKNNPGQRLFQIDNDTMQSHHNWGAQLIVKRLEQQGKIIINKKTTKGTFTTYEALLPITDAWCVENPEALDVLNGWQQRPWLTDAQLKRLIPALNID